MDIDGAGDSITFQDIYKHIKSLPCPNITSSLPSKIDTTYASH